MRLGLVGAIAGVFTGTLVVAGVVASAQHTASRIAGAKFIGFHRSLLRRVGGAVAGPATKYFFACLISGLPPIR